MCELKNWQKDIIRVIKSEPDSCKYFISCNNINEVVDFVDFLLGGLDNIVYITDCSVQNINSVLLNSDWNKCNTLIVNCFETSWIPYCILDNVKSGLVCNNEESKKHGVCIYKIFNPPHLIIFHRDNMFCDVTDSFSKFYSIVGEDLVEINDTGCCVVS